MNRGTRPPQSSLDHNRYLYDEMETREPSLTSCSKISEIDFDRFNDIIQSKVVSPSPSNNPPVQCNRDNKENLMVKREEKKTLGMMGRQLNYKVLTQQTEEDEQDTAQRMLLVILENERLRMQTNQLKSSNAQVQADLIRSEGVREGLFCQVVKLQALEEGYKQELKSKDSKLEEIYKELTWYKGRNQELSNQVENAKRWLSDYGSMNVTGQQALSQAQEEIAQLKSKVQSLMNVELQYKQRLVEENRKREEQVSMLQSIQIKRSEQTLSQWEEKSSKLEDENVKLRFELSKIKADLSMRASKQKDFSMDVSRTESLLKQREVEYRQESKRWTRRVQELEVERHRTDEEIRSLEVERKQLTEEIRAAKDTLRTKQHELEELRKGKQVEFDLHKGELKRLQQQLTAERESKTERIQCLEELVEKLKRQQQMEKQQYSKTLDVYKKELDEVMAKVASFESDKATNSLLQITITKVKAENAALKEQISDQYRSILMFENKIRAYELRIQTLESAQIANKQQQQQQQQQKPIQPQPSVARNSDPIIIEDRCLLRNYDTRQYRSTTEHATLQSTADNFRPKSLMHHYPSSGTIRAQDIEEYRRERRRCASRDRIDYISSLHTNPSYQLPRQVSRPSSSASELRDDPINVTLPLRRDHHLSRPHQRKESLNEAIVRKCRVMNC